MLADLSNTLTRDKQTLTLKCLAKREQRNVANLCFLPKTIIRFLKASADKKCFMQITSCQ